MVGAAYGTVLGQPGNGAGGSGGTGSSRRGEDDVPPGGGD